MYYDNGDDNVANDDHDSLAVKNENVKTLHLSSCQRVSGRPALMS